MEGNLEEIVTSLEGNFAEKKEIGRKPYVPKVEALLFFGNSRLHQSRIPKEQNLKTERID